MVFVNYTTMHMTVKIVYYGPGLCGKTTNLQYVHQKTAPKSRGEMVSLETQADRTLFFDLLPLEVGVVGGLKVRLQLYTVPGQVFYNATRKLVLKGADGVVFVADSQTAMLDADIESFQNLRENLAELGLDIDSIPLVFQYNKRDIRNILTVEQLNDSLNRRGAPCFEAAALHGLGVFETLKGISRLTIQGIRDSALAERTAVKPPAPSAPAPVSQAVRPAPQPVAPLPAGPPTPEVTAAPADPLGHLVSEVPPVEFAEEDTDKLRLRAVRTRESVDIQRELEKLREVTAQAPERPSRKPRPDAALRLEEMLRSERESSRDFRRRASLGVPFQLLKNCRALNLHLGFADKDGEHLVRDAVSVKLDGEGRLRRLTLHVDLELSGED